MLVTYRIILHTYKTYSGDGRKKKTVPQQFQDTNLFAFVSLYYIYIYIRYNPYLAPFILDIFYPLISCTIALSFFFIYFFFSKIRFSIIYFWEFSIVYYTVSHFLSIRGKSIQEEVQPYIWLNGITSTIPRRMYINL